MYVLIFFTQIVKFTSAKFQAFASIAEAFTIPRCNAAYPYGYSSQDIQLYLHFLYNYLLYLI
jgi:hypothetical protein